MHLRHRTLVLLAVVLLAGPWVFTPAGDLEPPGPPGPTMKPLSEIEPRRPIRPDMLPFTISEPGSYYLTGHVETDGGGITIESSHVTLDLEGFTLKGGVGYGILGTWLSSDITIRNGTLEGWENDGIHLEGADTRLERIRSRNNGGHGIYVYSFALVRECETAANALSGVYVVYANSQVLDTRSTGNDQNGIVMLSSGGTIRGCYAGQNRLNGIRVEEGTAVVDNTSYNNGWGTETKCGILVTGGSNVIDGNAVIANNIGIQIDDAGNVVVRNVLIENYTRDVIVAGNDVGPWGTAASVTSPWANIVR